MPALSTADWIAVSSLVVTGIGIPILLWKYRNYKSPSERALEEVLRLRIDFSEHTQSDIRAQGISAVAQVKLDTTLSNLDEKFDAFSRNAEQFRNDARDNFARIHQRIDDIVISSNGARPRATSTGEDQEISS